MTGYASLSMAVVGWSGWMILETLPQETQERMRNKKVGGYFWSRIPDTGYRISDVLDSRKQLALGT